MQLSVNIVLEQITISCTVCRYGRKRSKSACERKLKVPKVIKTGHSPVKIIVDEDERIMFNSFNKVLGVHQLLGRKVGNVEN